MIAVDHPTLFHPQCLVTKRADPKFGPYVDLLKDFDHDHQGRMYVSRVAVETMAKTLGLPSSDEVEELRVKVAEKDARLQELEGEIESLREFEKAARYTVEHMGQKVRKKPGRPPKPKEPTHA